jgi:hypothetical protein
VVHNYLPSCTVAINEPSQSTLTRSVLSDPTRSLTVLSHRSSAPVDFRSFSKTIVGQTIRYPLAVKHPQPFRSSERLIPPKISRQHCISIHWPGGYWASSVFPCHKRWPWPLRSKQTGYLGALRWMIPWRPMHCSLVACSFPICAQARPWGVEFEICLINLSSLLRIYDSRYRAKRIFSSAAATAFVLSSVIYTSAAEPDDSQEGPTLEKHWTREPKYSKSTWVASSIRCFVQ